MYLLKIFFILLRYLFCEMYKLFVFLLSYRGLLNSPDSSEEPVNTKAYSTKFNTLYYK